MLFKFFFFLKIYCEYLWSWDATAWFLFWFTWTVLCKPLPGFDFTSISYTTEWHQSSHFSWKGNLYISQNVKTIPFKSQAIVLKPKERRELLRLGSGPRPSTLPDWWRRRLICGASALASLCRPRSCRPELITDAWLKQRAQRWSDARWTKSIKVPVNQSIEFK